MIIVGWASRPSREDGRDAHPTFKSVNYLICDPKNLPSDAPARQSLNKPTQRTIFYKSYKF